MGADNINGWLSTHAAQSSANPADVLITLGNEAITLKNVAVTSLHVSDFSRVAASRYLALRLVNSHWLREIDAIF